MSTEQEDRGVEPETEDVMQNTPEVEVEREGHILDGIGQPAAAEDDIPSD